MSDKSSIKRLERAPLGLQLYADEYMRMHGLSARTNVPQVGRINVNGKRWMAFVDGENLTIRLQEELVNILGAELETELSEEFYQRDKFLWCPDFFGDNYAEVLARQYTLQPEPVRVSFYGSCVGNEQTLVCQADTR